MNGSVESLLARLVEPSWVVRRAVVAALARAGDAAIEPLCHALRATRDDEARLAAIVDALATSEGNAEPHVIRLAADADPSVVADAARILGRRRSANAVAVLAELTRHSDDNVVVAAIEALARIGGSAAVDPIIALPTTDSFFRTFPVIDFLGRCGDPRAVARLVTLLDDPRYCVEAARALGRLRARFGIESTPGQRRSGDRPVDALLALAAYIEEKVGIECDPIDREHVADKIATRATDAGFESLHDYHDFLRFDQRGEAELDALVDTLVVSETYFFREVDQLHALIDRLLQPMIERGIRPRVLFAAAAGGEEPLTMAMLLDERRMLDRVDLWATDISLSALQRAREGAYNGRSLRAVPHDVARWMAMEGKRGTVRTDLRSAVTWRRMNLVDERSVRAHGTFDAVLCRNVLIYFSDRTARKVVLSLSDVLNPGGYLAVGASESLLRFGTPLDCQEHGGAFFYRKAE